MVNTPLFFLFLLVDVVVDPGCCPVTGSMFSLDAGASALFSVDCDVNGNRIVSAISKALGLTMSGCGLSKKTVKLRADMMSNRSNESRK
jgi:hypothetical protein